MTVYGKFTVDTFLEVVGVEVLEAGMTQNGAAGVGAPTGTPEVWLRFSIPAVEPEGQPQAGGVMPARKF